jgi:hypothetical protein
MSPEKQIEPAIQQLFKIPFLACPQRLDHNANLLV